MSPGRLGTVATGVVVFALGAVTSLLGDACHVASGTTRYLWPGVPSVWKSAIWFPLLVGAAILGLARAGVRAGLPRRRRSRTDVVAGVAAVLALYAFTATLRGQSPVVSTILCAAVAVAIWAWWDPSAGALVLACVSAVVGPLAETGIVALGGAAYAADSSGLGGVAPWLPCLYFGAASVASGLWSPVQGAA